MHEIGHTLNMHHDFAFNGGHNPGWNGWGKTYLSQFCGRHERYCPDESDYFYGKSCTDVGGIMDYNFEASHYFLDTCDNRVSSEHSRILTMGSSTCSVCIF